MKNEKLFNETIGILTQAYENDALISGEPCACAIGNLLTARGVKVDRQCSWYDFISEYMEPFFGKDSLERYRPYINQAITLTGYSLDEIIQIEAAFEHAGSWKDTSDTMMFNRLMAVVDVLEKIHECDKETTTVTKQRFVKATT